jgi:hypothetical protein
MAKQDQSAGKRRKILDQAMEVLRETRAKIDPELLNAMKDKISAAGLAGPVQPKGAQEKKGIYSAEDVSGLSVKKVPKPKTTAGNAASAYAAQQAAKPFEAKSSKDVGPEMVPVDRQKVAAIVMEYMRLREEKKPGH